jgi:2-C-methyl-D-erythritol 4-phosphate cytidylyltransferase
MTMPPLSEACAVLTAAGSGSRLGCEVPKALVELSGRPLVWWAARGLRAGGVGTIVVTAPAASLDEFRAGIADIGGVEVVAGSDRSRQASVALGLAALGQRNEGDVVLVHDAARPLTPAQVTARVIDAVRAGAGAVIPVLPVTDTLKSVDASGVVTGTPRRADMVAVQTPQGFRWDVLTRAHEAGASLGADEAVAATDDAGLVEAIGAVVHTVAGDERSLKVTRPLDLSLARLLAGQERLD